MPNQEKFDILVLGSGTGGKLLAWQAAKAGHRTAVVERQWIGGSCPNVACMPSKSEIWSARVAHYARNAARFGAANGELVVDMHVVRQRKREMVAKEVAAHRQNYSSSGAELIMGSGRFIAPKTLEVRLNDGGTRLLTGEQVFLNVGTHAAIPDVAGLAAAHPLTHIEALELDRLPSHIVILGGGYVGLEMAQAYRRFGSRVTVIEAGPQILGREDSDVATEMQRILAEEGIEFLTSSRLINVKGRSGEEVRLNVGTPSGDQEIEGTDILVATGRVPEHRVDPARCCRRRVERARLYTRQRAARDDRTWGMGARGMRRQPAIHPRLGRRLSDHLGQSHGRAPHDARPPHPLLRVHRPAARPCGLERSGGKPASDRHTHRAIADERRAACTHDRRATRLHEGDRRRG